jgi:hypothetical protein
VHLAGAQVQRTGTRPITQPLRTLPTIAADDLVCFCFSGSAPAVAFAGGGV